MPHRTPSVSQSRTRAGQKRQQHGCQYGAQPHNERRRPFSSRHQNNPISIRVGFVAAMSAVIATLPTMQYQPLARPKKRMQGKHETLNSSKFTHVDEAGLHCHNELRNQAHTIALREDISARHFRTSSGCTTPFTQQNNSPLDLSPICTLGCQLGPE